MPPSLRRCQDCGQVETPSPKCPECHGAGSAVLPPPWDKGGPRESCGCTRCACGVLVPISVLPLATSGFCTNRKSEQESVHYQMGGLSGGQHLPGLQTHTLELQMNAMPQMFQADPFAQVEVLPQGTERRLRQVYRRVKNIAITGHPVAAELGNLVDRYAEHGDIRRLIRDLRTLQGNLEDET